jgi:hypothetical protein
MPQRHTFCVLQTASTGIPAVHTIASLQSANLQHAFSRSRDIDAQQQLLSKAIENWCMSLDSMTDY